MELFNKVVVGAMPVIPKNLVGKIASRYVAGDTLTDAVNVVRGLNEKEVMATIDLLGEHSDNEDDVRWVGDVYKEVLDKIEETGIDSNVSIKPTALGLKIGYNFCKRMVEEIVAHAAERGNFIRIDMEDHECTDDTLRMYYELSREFENVGVVIQAYLRRTIKDVQWLKKMRANIRVCKGIYNEPRKIAWKNRAIIIRNYLDILRELLEAGSYVGIATHCEEVVWGAQKIIRDLKLEPESYEFQMLLGVDKELIDILTGEGHRLRVYVPFGEEWYPYSSRRLKENPELAGNIAKDFLGISKKG